MYDRTCGRTAVSNSRMFTGAFFKIYAWKCIRNINANVAMNEIPVNTCTDFPMVWMTNVSELSSIWPRAELASEMYLIQQISDRMNTSVLANLSLMSKLFFLARTNALIFQHWDKEKFAFISDCLSYQRFILVRIPAYYFHAECLRQHSF